MRRDSRGIVAPQVGAGGDELDVVVGVVVLLELNGIRAFRGNGRAKKKCWLGYPDPHPRIDPSKTHEKRSSSQTES